MKRWAVWLLGVALAVACDDTGGQGQDDVLVEDSATSSTDVEADTAETDVATVEDLTEEDTSATTDATSETDATADATSEDATTTDATEDTAADAADDVVLPDCPRRRLVGLPISEIMLEGPAEQPLIAEKSFRLSLTYSRAACYKRASPELEIDTATKTLRVSVRAFQALGEQCDRLTSDTRLVTVSLQSGGTWTVVDANGDATLSLTVAEPNDGPCGTAGDCAKDCACSEPGQVCLSGLGQGGLFASCATPCESNLDCDGRCTSFDDGLDSICETTLPQCDDANPCPQDYRCESGACVAPVRLGQGTRVACDCDDDCDAPLRCVESGVAGELPRCELPCETPGMWCAGGHFCGDAEQDVSGLARTDSICVWAGE